MQWQPATVETVTQIVKEDLTKCNEQQTVLFRQYAVEPYQASILRFGKIEKAIVVARRGDEVIYWEDVEEGFCISPLGSDGQILESCSNQDDLVTAINYWLNMP
jgi:hypothetical protein